MTWHAGLGSRFITGTLHRCDPAQRTNRRRRGIDSPIVFAIKWFILLAVLGAIVAGAAIIVTGFMSILNATWELIEAERLNVEVLRGFSVEVIEVADAFLLDVVMFIIALGL